MYNFIQQSHATDNHISAGVITPTLYDEFHIPTSHNSPQELWWVLSAPLLEKFENYCTRN